MSLYGALFAGVSGLSAQSSAMGAIADNVTNVNTVGYKGTNVNFQTLVTKQVSLTKYSPGGVQSTPRAGIDVQGLLQATTSSTDLGVSGDGFFIVNGASRPSTGDLYGYSRAGSFKVDKDGYLQNVSGYYLQGWPLQTWDGTLTASTVTKGNDVFMKSYKNEAGETSYINDNVIDNTNLRPLNLNTIGGTATATTTLSMGANLPASDDVNATHKTNALIYDSLGNSHNLNYTWVKKSDNTWNYIVEPPAGAAQIQVKDQDGLNYFSAGRLDFRSTGMPADGATFSFDGTTINFDSTVNPGGGGFAAGDDFLMVPQQTLAAPAAPADGATLTLALGGGGKTFTFEWDSDGSISTGGAIAVGITGAANTNADALATAIQGQMEGVLGAGEWARHDPGTGNVLIGGPTGTTITGGAAAGAFNINVNPNGKTLSQVISQLSQAMNAVLTAQQGSPPTVPGHWAARVAGTTGITFHPDAANDIAFDTTNLLDSNGDIAVLQTDADTGNQFTVPSASGSIGWVAAGGSGVTFNGDGTPDTFFGHDESTEPDPRGKIHIDWTNGALNMDDTDVTSGGAPALTQFMGNYNVADGLTQLSGNYQISYLSQNGANFGNFAGLSVGEDGIVTALFDNGVTRPVFMVPLATFVNPNGMESMTGNAWIETSNSGQPTVREAGDAGAGTIASASLESSTVDLGEEFTNMITTQRAYSAAAKIITTSDEMLDELVRIKR